MITNNSYKQYVQEIANLFCESSPTPGVCAASTYERMVTNLSNSEFSFVLANLNIGRFYLVEILGYQTRENLCWYTQRMVDLITGQSMDYGFSTQSVGCERCPTISCLKSKYAQKGWEIISGNKDFSAANYKNIRLVYVVTDPAYGLTYTPGSVGGGSQPSVPVVPGSGGNFIPTSSPVLSPVEAGFDLQGLLSNPIIWIAGGSLLLFYLMKKNGMF